MHAPRTRPIPCVAGCGATIKRRGSWGSCSQCSALVSAYLKATAGTRDPSAWVRACNATFSNRDEFTRVAAAERAA